MAEREIWELANMGEICAWLVQDDVAVGRFAAWYNECSARFGMDKPPVTVQAIQMSAQSMFMSLAEEVAART